MRLSAGLAVQKRNRLIVKPNRISTLYHILPYSKTPHFSHGVFIHTHRNLISNVAIHLRHPPSHSTLRRTRGYGGQDVKVLPIPITNYLLPLTYYL
jgi:hypothetical protein